MKSWIALVHVLHCATWQFFTHLRANGFLTPQLNTPLCGLHGEVTFYNFVLRKIRAWCSGAPKNLQTTKRVHQTNKDREQRQHCSNDIQPQHPHHGVSGGDRSRQEQGSSRCQITAAEKYQSNYCREAPGSSGIRAAAGSGQQHQKSANSGNRAAALFRVYICSLTKGRAPIH